MHRLTHILSDGIEKFWSWQFSDGSISPPEGTYRDTPSILTNISHNDPVSIEFVKRYSNDPERKQGRLWQVRLYSEHKILINKHGNDKRYDGWLWDSVEMIFKVGERIVSVKVDVKDDRWR